MPIEFGGTLRDDQHEIRPDVGQTLLQEAGLVANLVPSPKSRPRRHFKYSKPGIKHERQMYPHREVLAK
jgi:hypothetical protein